MKRLPLALTWKTVGISTFLLIAALAWIKPIPSNEAEVEARQAQGNRSEPTIYSKSQARAVARPPEPAADVVSLAPHPAGPATDPPIPDEVASAPRRPPPLPRLAKPEATGGSGETRSLNVTRAAAVAPGRGGSLPATGVPPATPDDAADLAPLVVPFSILAPSEPATIPAALAVGESGSPFSETEQAEADRLADSFFQALSGTTESPTDPDYRQQWQQAQEDTDARMRASLGGHAWLDRHREVHREVLRTERSPAPAPAASPAPPAIP